MDTVIKINTPYIKLDAFLKFAGIVETGGIAKRLIEDEFIRVNGEVCVQRGKKLYDGDVVTFDGVKYTLSGADA